MKRDFTLETQKNLRLNERHSANPAVGGSYAFLSPR